MLPVQSSSIRPVFSPQKFCERSKTCCCAATVEEAVFNTQLVVSLLQSLGFTDNKPQEVITDFNTSDNLPGFPNRLNVHDALPVEKNRQNSRLLSLFARFSRYDIAKPGKFNRSVRVLETWHLPSSTSPWSLTIRPDKGPTNEPVFLRRLDYPVTECQSRNGLVVETHPQFKQQSRTPSSAGYDHHNRRLQERLGRSASILSDQWQMVPKRVSPKHQLSSAKGVLFGLENLSQRQVSRNRISATRQHDHHCLHQQQSGYTFPQLMTLALNMWDWCQERDILVIASRIPGRDNVSADKESREFTDMSEWKLNPIYNYSAFSTELSDRPICESSNQSTRGLHQLETRPGSHPHRCLHHKLGYSTELRLPPPTPLRLRLLISQPVLLPNSPTLLTDPTDLNRVHPMYPRLHVAVFHISTNVSKLRAFQQMLPIYSSKQLVPPHTKPTSLVGAVGAAGVLDGKLVLFRHLSARVTF